VIAEEFQPFGSLCCSLAVPSVEDRTLCVL
jgi:hypothetical protein